jgi:putative membrane protein
MNRKKIGAVLTMLAAGCCLTALSAAADDKKDAKDADKTFAHKASASGLAEVNLSIVAERNSKNPAIRRFAQQMVADHTKANKELIALANARSMPLARTMDEKHQKLHEKLGKLNGTELDEAYMEGMVKDHEEAVKLFEKESKDGDDEGLKQWAGTTLPILKRHLESAQTICKNMKGKGEKGKDRTDR